jgi:hypothetical protein
MPRFFFFFFFVAFSAFRSCAAVGCLKLAVRLLVARQALAHFNIALGYGLYMNGFCTA